MISSHDPAAIVKRAKIAIEEGVIEIWLTSEDAGAYGRDINTNLPELLKSVIKILPNTTMLRLGRISPPYVMEYM